MEVKNKVKREYPQATITLKNSPFSPPRDGACLINQLPPEVLSRIFQSGIREKSLEPEFQVLVSHVCKHWRTVAHSTPALWTTINIGSMERGVLERVRCLVERSKGLPVSIRIDCASPDDEDSEDDDDDDDDDSENDGDTPGGSDPKPISLNDLNALLDILVPHVQRWRTFELGVFSYALMFPTLLKLSAPSVPAAIRLECLKLYHHGEFDPTTLPFPEYSAPLTLFGGEVPRLQTLALWCVHVDWNQNWLAGATQLVDLTLAYHADDVRPSWAAFARVLRGCPALKNLTLTASGPAGAPGVWHADGMDVEDKDVLNGVIELPELTDLVLSFYVADYITAIMRKLALPSLKGLSLDLKDGDFSDFVLQLSGPAPTPSGVKPDTHSSVLDGLENLEILGLPCNNSVVNDLYAKLSNLQSLQLYMDDLDSIFFSSLGTGKGKIWLPALAKLTISGVSGSDMREMITARREAGYPLKIVSMEGSENVDKSDVEWLRENVEEFDFLGDTDSLDDEDGGDDDEGEGGEGQDEDEESEDEGEDGEREEHLEEEDGDGGAEEQDEDDMHYLE
ncbi:hypothetical protein BJ138DRAFT_675108 [Hygrophoropsis aurantiaca]|uniref:Uncharacterized protein n=1 Tax=Hygrophoropsis aurantiaca TaxID=72124 RepID=A0ACB7ZYV1_9AGAM|nr:hypothetical protein BJ138DRAFT_675108 [Hygrophoropsis aurantiaca]